MKFTAKWTAGAFAKGLEAKGSDVARSATGAMRVVTDSAKREVRALVVARLGSKWGNAVRGQVYPRRGNALSPAGVVYVRSKFFGIFADGGTIRGKPLLWLPLKGVPQKIGSKRMTPKLFTERFGPLSSLNRPGRAPLLMARLSAPKRKAANPPKFSVARVQRNPGGAAVLVPVFVGIPAARMPKLFALREAVARAAQTLGAEYLRNVRSS